MHQGRNIRLRPDEANRRLFDLVQAASIEAGTNETEKIIDTLVGEPFWSRILADQAVLRRLVTRSLRAVIADVRSTGFLRQPKAESVYD